MTDIGFIGLGAIGLPMARRVVQAGHSLTLWNRTTAKAEGLRPEGAQVAASPAMLIGRCSLVGLCLASDEAVDEVVSGDEGLFSGDMDGRRRVIVDFSTGSPERAAAWADAAARRGMGWIDAPVSGGVPAAEEGRLTLFLGGMAEDIVQAAPLLEVVSARRTHMGTHGAGQRTKLCNQMIVAATMLSIAEAFAAGRRAGLDVGRLTDALRGGFADSAPLRIFGPRMAAHSFEPRLGSMALLEKDIVLALAMTSQHQGTAPMTMLCRSLLDAVRTTADLDIEADLSSLIRIFED